MQQRQKNYSLVLLMLVLALGYLDRMTLGVVLQAIKVDLHLTDTQLGLLTGLGYAFFFSLVGIPIARWADRGDRVMIVAVTTGLWGVAIALSSIAGTFIQLILIRMAVAIGDAGSSPPANSLIPDYFSREERPRAVARYMLGNPLGIMAGYLAGGWLSELYGWRMTFVLIALPGIVLAGLAAFVMYEPRRQLSQGRVHAASPGSAATARSSTTVDQRRFKEVIAALVANATFRHLLAFFSVWYFCGWAFQLWMPTYLIRQYGLSTGELGTWFAVSYASAGFLGTWVGGEWGSRYAPRNERLQLVVIAIVATLSQIVGMGALVAPNQYWAFAAIAVGSLGGATVLGPVFAAIQTLVHPNMRATALTIISVLPGIVGMGLGPSTAGVLSDALQPWAGEDSLRYALLLFTPGYLWSAWHLHRASQTITSHIADALKNAAVESADIVEPTTGNLRATERAALSSRS